MNRTMEIAASGMAAQQLVLDVVANNLANAEVVGFKGSAPTFSELAAGATAGLGTLPTGTRPVFDQGKLMQSGGPFDVAIDGPGFFVLHRDDGSVAFTRAGAFARAADGSVRNAAGWRLDGVRVPAQASAVRVEPDGRVLVDLPGRVGLAAGRIRLALFTAPDALRPIGDAIYAPTTASGAPHMIDARNDAGGSKLAFGMLERSNVSIPEAMMQILNAQRAYEANAKGVQAADEMQRIANNLHRG